MIYFLLYGVKFNFFSLFELERTLCFFFQKMYRREQLNTLFMSCLSELDISFHSRHADHRRDLVEEISEVEPFILQECIVVL